MKIIIFAKHKSSLKVILACNDDDFETTLKMLNKMYGREWIKIEELNPVNEMLFFRDKQTYFGFDNRNHRYVDGIEQKEAK